MHHKWQCITAYNQDITGEIDQSTNKPMINSSIVEITKQKIKFKLFSPKLNWLYKYESKHDLPTHLLVVPQ